MDQLSAVIIGHTAANSVRGAFRIRAWIRVKPSTGDSREPVGLVLIRRYLTSHTLVGGTNLRDPSFDRVFTVEEEVLRDLNTFVDRGFWIGQEQFDHLFVV